MSGGAAHRELLAFLLRGTEDETAQRDLVHALEAGRTGPFDFLYSAAVEAGCSAEVARARTAGTYACFAAGNVADDLADGECTYLERASATGPAVEFVLLHAAYALWLDTGRVPSGVAARAASALSRGACLQLREVRTERFTLAATRAMAEGMGGDQYAAYLAIAWSGTPLERRAIDVGVALGTAAMIAEDRRSGSRRFVDLAPDHRRLLLALARERVEAARAVDLPCLRAALRWVEPLLQAEP